MPEQHGSRTYYPETHDPAWMRDHYELGAYGIAALLGCSWHHAATQLWTMGFGAYRCWNELELVLLEQFYPHHPAVFLADALGRSLHALYKKAHYLGVRSLQLREPFTEAQRSNFWAEWRTYVRTNLRGWQSNGWAEDALRLTWRPARPELECGEKCPLRVECGADGKLPCERVTLKELYADES